MGGNVAWTIRLEDGTEYRMDRWTNIFPDICHNINFLSGDPDTIQDSIAQWLDMKADWENKTKLFQMTDNYAPYPFGLKPSEYGVIYTDFVTKTLVSCQHYTSFDEIYLLKAFIGEERSIWSNDTLLGKARFAKYCFDHKLILGYVYYDEKTKSIALDKDIPSVFSQAIYKGYLHDSSLPRIKIKLPDPWKLYDYAHDKKGMGQALDRILETGVVLTEKELKSFNSYIKRGR